MDRHQDDSNQALDMRSDLMSMMMPFFPEEPGLREFTAKLGDYSIRISADDPDIAIATPADRKILNLLAGAIARDIRSGAAPSRHLAIDTKLILETLSEGNSYGGSQYGIVLDRLNRLMSTVIETEMPLGDDISRRRKFRWIDGYEHDDQQIPGGRKILRLQITISEDAYIWMTRNLGFDISRQDFQSITSSRSSLWRIYEICLAQLVIHRAEEKYIPINLIRERVPITSPLKTFKSRTLRNAIEEITSNPTMAKHIRVSLARRTATGFEEIEFSQRAKLETLYVHVVKGPAPLPPLKSILSEDDVKAMTEKPGELSMNE